ncbi:MAG: hypothetical protein ACEY3D_01200 [Rickettsia sp.]|uniref:hypothetical protein n=1 Tax=Rickettsia sp. TaxID=789 RepID=UPI00397B7FBA
MVLCRRCCIDRFSVVIPRACSGIQLKILKLLVFQVVFMAPWSSHGVTQRVLPIHAITPFMDNVERNVVISC